MRIFGPRLKIALYTRFIIANTFILIFLVGSILFLIERREVRTIYEESKSRGILKAQYIASLNLESLTFWDAAGIKSNIDREIDDSLIYVVIYDKFRNPYVFTDLIRDNEAIKGSSRPPVRVSEEMSAAGRREFRRGGETVPITEMGGAVFA